MLDDRAFRSQIALEHCNRSIRSDRLIIGTNNIILCQMEPAPLIGCIQPFLAALIETIFL